MEDIERILAMIRRGMNSVLDLWPVKLLISALATLWTWLFGGTEAIFAAVLGFVVLDTLTKWASITKRYLIDHGADPARINICSIITGWFCAWEPNYLESSKLLPIHVVLYVQKDFRKYLQIFLSCLQLLSLHLILH